MSFNIYRHMEEHGQMKARITSLEARCKAQEAAVTTLQGTRHKALGAWGALLAVGSVAGCLGAIIARVFFH